MEEKKVIGEDKKVSIVPEQKEIEHIEAIRHSREALKQENDLLEQELARKERLRAEVMIGGKTDAGSSPPPLELSPKEYVKKVMSGNVS